MKHTYPSKYPPGTSWHTDAAWEILDIIKPGVLDDDVRAVLGGMIAGRVSREREQAAKIADTRGCPHIAKAIRDAK